MSLIVFTDYFSSALKKVAKVEEGDEEIIPGSSRTTDFGQYVEISAPRDMCTALRYTNKSR